MAKAKNLKDQDGVTYEDAIREMGLELDPDGHYVNNKELYEHMKMYEIARDKALAEGKEKPPVDDFIGEAIMKIATHLAFRPNFSGYSYRSEMIGDAIENCLQYIDSFDCSKSQNPFAYLTQVCWCSFVRRLKLEKKQRLIKGKLMMTSTFEETMDLEDDSDQKIVEDVMSNVHTFVLLAQEEDEKLKAKQAEKKALQEQKKREAYVPTALEEWFIEE